MTITRRRPHRLAAGLLAGLIGLSASPLLGVQVAAAADALPPIANPLANGAFCDNAPTTNPFTDLGGETASTRETILCLVATKLTSGTTATTYSPGESVTRRQMALFIKRLADLLNVQETGAFDLASLPPYDGARDYDDVASNDIGAVAIGQLTQANIVGGFPDGTFRPNALVSRRQMAAFVNNLQKFLGGTAFSTTKDFFLDDEGDSGEANLNALAAVGIFQGDGAGHVSPGAALTRRQMANILLRDAQVLQSAGIVESPFAPPSNATLTVRPRTTLTRILATEPSTTDDRKYTVSGLTAGTSYTIQLFPAANVQGTTTRTFTEDGSTNTADDGTVAADITVVNGGNIGSADDNATAQPVSGQITFTVDGVATETVLPVVFRDADSDGKVDLKADNTPVATEPFGVGAITRFLPAEAASGTRAFTVSAITSERDAFIAGGVTYFMDTNDTYQYAGTAITKTQFDSMLSVGDAGTVTYNPGGVSVFNMTSDDVDAPATPTITMVDGDNPGTTLNDARVTYTRPASNSSGVTYSLQRAAVDDGVDNTCGSVDDAAPGAFATVATATQAAGTGAGVFVFSDDNVTPDGCYTYRVRATGAVSGATADSASPYAEPSPGTPDTIEPFSYWIKRTTNAGTAAFDAGDVITVVFTETMAAPAANASIQLQDGDLTLGELVNGVNATFILNTDPVVTGEAGSPTRPARSVLTITLTAAPSTTISATCPLCLPGVTPGLQAPADVTASSGIADTSANAWQLSGSDAVVDSV